MSETAQPGAAPADAIAALVARRRKVRLWWQGSGAWSHAADAAQPIGLAFSGGGYAGCFLRSLFVPAVRRGIEAVPEAPTAALDRAIADQYALAHQALASGPNEREIVWRPAGAAQTTKLRNPLWWLREHSRYLAPTGPTDYGFAVAYVARNWLAMIYLFVLACTAIATLLVFAEAAVLTATGWRGFGMVGQVPLSPLFALAAIPALFIVALFIGYWATQAMSANERDEARQRESLRATIGQILRAGTIALLFLCIVIGIVSVYAHVTVSEAIRHKVGPLLTVAVIAGAGATLLGALADSEQARKLNKPGSMLTSELRLALTNRLAKANLWMIAIVVIALVDSLGAAADRALQSATPRSLSLALLPILAFLIKKLPDWFGGPGKSASGGLLQRFATGIALIVGVVLYGLLAVAAAALVHHVAWAGEAWVGTPSWPRLVLLAGLAWILAIVSGRANGFINLSSLHALYGARLTRAYLGASNVGRLVLAADDAHPTPVTENHPADYIQPRVYGETDLPAPIHIVNVTLNETIDPRSQIVARDRKGDIMSLEPGGVRIGKDLVDWGRLTNDPPDAERTHAENVSLGQWIAISGAAASSGMGRMTSLGFALAFTFANVRLGYWWWAPRVCPDMPPTTGFKGWVAQYFGTFVYLANEMTCRYSRGYDRKYLTDGGHYENSGAYPLIRRRVPTILVSDNGADPGYAFEDLQTLIRQVRIDLGGETTILEGADLAAFAGTLGTRDLSIFVDPATAPDWKARMTDATAPAFVLALRVRLDGDLVHLVWIKPRLLPNVPADVAGYAASTRVFPQQPTGDQFFDEAQWESYRRLGEESMSRLLTACPSLLG